MKAAGSDRVAPEIINALPWKALRIIRQTFERRYMGIDTQLVESWPNTHNRSDTLAMVDARHLPAEHTGEVVLWILVQHASNPPLRQLLKDLETERHVHLLTDTRTEIAAMMRIMVASAHEWENDMHLHVAFLDLKQAIDCVTPKLLYEATLDSTTHLTLAMALLREQVGGWNMVTFQEIKVGQVGEGGKESPTLFNMVMLYWMRLLSAVWNERRQGYRT